MAIIKSSYQTRSKGIKRVMESFRYYSYRQGPDLAERQWYSQDGRALDFEGAREEIRDRAQHYGYTYRITLSTKEVALAPDDYRAVLGDQFQDYYFVPHRNTEHPHVHVVAFGKKVVHRDGLAAMRERLSEREQAHEQVHSQEIEQQPDQEYHAQEQGQRHDREYELE